MLTGASMRYFPMRLLFALAIICIAGTADAQQFAALSPKEKEPSAFAKALRLIFAISAPAMSERTRNRIVDEYEVARQHKAQAFEPAKKVFWRAIVRESPKHAEDAALEGCQIRSGAPCAILAINDEVVGTGGLVTRDMPRLTYRGVYDPAKVPTVREITLKRAEIESYPSQPTPKAMALHPSGRLFSASGKNTIQQAIDAALVQCNGNRDIDIARDGPCFVYALNNDVVFPERMTK